MKNKLSAHLHYWTSCICLWFALFPVFKYLNKGIEIQSKPMGLALLLLSILFQWKSEPDLKEIGKQED